MRVAEAFLLLVASLGVTGCATPGSSQPPPARWTTGFWFWQGSSIDAAWSGETLDVLFVQAGTIRQEDGPQYVRTPGNGNRQWFAYGRLPQQLPAARDYWAVF